MDFSGQERVLVVRTDSRVCAVPLESVEEVMRPLPTEAVPGMPPFLLGVAIIRGAPVPVVNLGSLVGTPNPAPIHRFVVFRLKERRVAIAVEAVLGLHQLGCSLLWSLSPILEEANPALVTAVSVSDQHLLFVLQVARIVPDRLWKELESPAADP